jgi:hypothetical protein
MTYVAQPTTPPQLYDALLCKVSSVHETFECACDRPYMLNRFLSEVQA